MPFMTQSPQDASSPKSSREASSSLVCRICGKPVPIETVKANGDGKAIHDECYAIKVKLEQASLEGHAHRTRSWKDVAAEVSCEQDSKKMTELVAELNQALDEQELDVTPKGMPDNKPQSHGK